MNLKSIFILGVILLCGSITLSANVNHSTNDTESMMQRYLYKVLASDAWEESQKGEFLILSADDEAFVHLSTSEQLDRIIGKYWADNPDYVILEIETQKLEGDLILEANPGGTNKYYHLYNAQIPIDSINKVMIR